MPRAKPHGRTSARTGDDWYCGVCGPVREPCSECGRIRPIHTRDRDGKPRRVACPPDGGGDPLERAVDVIILVTTVISKHLDSFLNCGFGDVATPMTQSCNQYRRATRYSRRFDPLCSQQIIGALITVALMNDAIVACRQLCDLRPKHQERTRRHKLQQHLCRTTTRRTESVGRSGVSTKTVHKRQTKQSSARTLLFHRGFVGPR